MTTEMQTTKYITMFVDNELFGVNILDSMEITSDMDITPVPNVDKAIKGCINIRGQAVYVIDLGLRIGLSPYQPTPDTRIVVCYYGDDKEPVGMIVDKVGVVVEVADSAVEPVPDNLGDVESEFLTGVVALDSGKILSILNLDAVFSIIPPPQS